VIQENYKKFQCKKCDYGLWKVVAGRQYEPEEVDELLSKRVVGPLQGFRSKMGRPFAAMIRLNAEHLPEFDFGQGGSGEGEAEAVDFSGQETLGIVSQMRRFRLRAWHGLCLRKGCRCSQDLRFPLRQGHPAAGHHGKNCQGQASKSTREGCSQTTQARGQGLSRIRRQQTSGSSRKRWFPLPS
jgi:RNase P subunit RPR2